MIGQTLGHYRIESKLGEGGMGVVYKALDTHLDRPVAIKILSETFARDPERLARFEREAKVLASLNHPNIAAIHGFEQAGGVPFLVLEYVPGDTLKGPLPVDEALAVARQIADALEAAHNKGVVHRDLKPANIKITPEGKVKVLDFGLAKALSDEPSGDPTQSPTLSIAATRAGTILGTAAYMSPEQARGRNVDKRTDIWSFGCVLYEIMTGVRAFSGESVTDVLASVVGKDPDWSRLPADTPRNVQRLLRLCLQKDASRRLRDVGDAWIESDEPQPETPRPPTPGPRPLALRALPWALAALMTAAAAALGVVVWRLTTKPQPLTRAVVPLPPTDRLLTATNPAVALSPDGTRLVFSANRSGYSQLYLRRLDQLEAAPIVGTEGAFGPFFSPDGEWVGFAAAGKLKKVLPSGGAPLTLCDIITPRGATWGADDTIIFAPSSASGSGLWRVSASGGAPKQLTSADGKNREHSHRWPQFLPGGKTVLFTVAMGLNPDENRIASLHLDTGERRTLFEGASYGRYVPTGHLIYARTGSLLAAPFDLRRLQVTGRQFPVVEGVSIAGSGAAQFDFSETGSLAYIPGGLTNIERSLLWVDRKGAASPISQIRRGFFTPRISPDGRQVGISTIATGSDVWIYETARDTLTRRTFTGASVAVWTPDGQRIAYGLGGSGLFWKPADGSGTEEQLTKSSNTQRPTSFSPDGKWLAYDETSSGQDIFVLALEGERKARPFVQTQFSEWGARFSPDGRWIAYGSNEGGPFQIYVQPFPGPGGKWQVSVDGGMEPVWSRNGRELFYRLGSRMMAVDIIPGSSFSAGKPRVVFEGNYFAFPQFTNYDVSPDGQRFLMIRDIGPETGISQINLVLNWFADLKARSK